MQTELIASERAELMAQRVHIFAKALRQEFAPMYDDNLYLVGLP